jgi:hypothetical protein
MLATMLVCVVQSFDIVAATCLTVRELRCPLRHCLSLLVLRSSLLCNNCLHIKHRAACWLSQVSHGVAYPGSSSLTCVACSKAFILIQHSVMSLSVSLLLSAFYN